MKKMLLSGAFLFAANALAMQQESHTPLSEAVAPNSEKDASPFKVTDLRLRLIKALFPNTDFHKAIKDLKAFLCVDKTNASTFKNSEGRSLYAVGSSEEQERSLEFLLYLINSGLAIHTDLELVSKLGMFDEKARGIFKAVNGISKSLITKIQARDYAAIVGILNEVNPAFRKMVLSYNIPVARGLGHTVPLTETILIEALAFYCPEELIKYLIFQGSALTGLPSTTSSPCSVVFKQYCEAYKGLQQSSKDEIKARHTQSMLKLNRLMDLLLASGACIHDGTISASDGITIKRPYDRAVKKNEPELLKYIESKGASNTQ